MIKYFFSILDGPLLSSAGLIKTEASGVMTDRDSSDVPDFEKLFNFTNFMENSRLGNLSYVGLHLTLFEDASNCRIDTLGSKARVFWLWRTNQCTPIYLHGQFTKEYYLFNDKYLSLMCEDSDCTQCRYNMTNVNQIDSTCRVLENENNGAGGPGQASFHSGRPLIYSWQSKMEDSQAIVANVFFSKDFCAFHPRYIEPQVIETGFSVTVT
jgi:hypothetical protein